MSGARMRILVADDSPSMRAFITGTHGLELLDHLQKHSTHQRILAAVSGKVGGYA